MADSGIVNIRGKDYHTVAKRISDYRSDHPKHCISTEIVNCDESSVLVKAEVKDQGGRLIATGHAEEVRGSSGINKTSAIENGETSAVGRALAFCGYGGTDIASANEVSDAEIQQAKNDVIQYYVQHQENVRRLFDEISAIKDGIANKINDAEAYKLAAESWFDMSQDDQRALWVAPSKGGIFTTQEREEMKSPEFREAHYG